MKISLLLLPFVVVFNAVSLSATGDEMGQPITLSVSDQPAQKLDGFGCSMVDLSKSKMPDSARKELFDLVFGDLKMNVLRLWVGSDEHRTVERMKGEFYRQYVDSGVIGEAHKRGVTTLLLAPARGEKAPTEPMSEYARKLADFIEAVRSERKIEIHVTGVANEPGGFTSKQFVEAIKALREELNTRNLKDVAIIGPESASADGASLALIADIKKDSEAWSALSGIATHSYNMAATPEFPEMITGTGKHYWMTEASDNGHENEDDADFAASISGRFLNDLNHGVTHWIYFIGFFDSEDVTRDHDNATKLLVYDFKQQRIYRHLKYDWFRQLRVAFPNGTQVYPLKGQPGGDLAFTYGQKPYLNAAAGKRPEGGWSLGLVNLSGVKPTTAISKWHPATTIKVTWQVAPLADVGAVTFKIYRSDVTQRFVSAGEATMTKGTLTFVSQPGEQITFLSR